MDIKLIWFHIKTMLTRPKAGMENIRTETGMMAECYFFLFVCCLCVGVSNIKFGFSNLFFETAIWYVALLFTTLGTWQLPALFGITATWAKALKIIAYSVFPFLLCLALANVIGYKPALFAIGFIYSVCLLYIGIDTVFKPEIKHTIIYIAAIIAIAIVSSYIARILIPA